MVIQGDKITYKVFNIYIYAMMNLIKAFNKKVNRLAINLSSRRHTLSALIACNRLNIIPIVLPLKKYQIPNTNYSKIANVDYELNDSNCIIQLKNKKNNFQYNYEKNSVQCVLFTSGSGLFPKAVELTFDNIYNSAKNWNDIFQFNKEEKYLNILPLHHVSGLSIFFRGEIILFIGRDLNELSPLNLAAIFCPHRRPSNIRTVEPEFLQFNIDFGDVNEPPLICKNSFFLKIKILHNLKHSIVVLTSLHNEMFFIILLLSIIDAIINILCDIDLSPLNSITP